MFSIGFMEIAVIALFALIFIGPSKLPEVAQQFGKFFVKFKRATSEARQVVDDVIREAEREIVLEEHQQLKEAVESEELDSQPVAQDSSAEKNNDHLVQNDIDHDYHKNDENP